MMLNKTGSSRFIEKKRAYNISHHPYPFKVKINRWELFKLIVKEIFHYKGKKNVITSTPCAYGVFSGPIGGFAARERLCVGCLRCTTEYPKISTILPNPEWQKMGDSYMTPYQVDTVTYEAEKGSLYVKGAGYRGKFGGTGWDSLWTDMSEIVRPTRDGIYGREHISTEVILGERPSFLSFNSEGYPIGALPRTCKIPFPMLLGLMPNAERTHPQCVPILAETAQQLGTYALLPLELIKKYAVKNPYVIPKISSSQWEDLKHQKLNPKIIELEGWDFHVMREIQEFHPETFLMMRCHFEDDLLSYYHAGFRIFHLTADPYGRNKKSQFILDLIRKAHLSFVKEKCRDHVTLIASGGITSAEHVPKAVLLGLDAVVLDTPLFVALQGQLEGKNAFYLRPRMDQAWGVQRLKNLMAAWQDQLFEFAGAMGIREVRRMRGESGRLLFQHLLEKEAFSEIKGYHG